jgi:hypothetical protein
MEILSLVFDPVAVHGLAATLAILLMFGAWQKLRDPVIFGAAVENYRLLPGALVPTVAIGLPLLEAAAGAMLLPPETAAVGSVIALSVLCLTTTAVAINLFRGRREIDCGCGGLSHQPLSWTLVLRNLALMAAAVVVMHGDVERHLVWLDYLTVAATVLALFGLYAVFNQLLANRPGTPIFR